MVGFPGIEDAFRPSTEMAEASLGNDERAVASTLGVVSVLPEAIAVTDDRHQDASTRVDLSTEPAHNVLMATSVDSHKQDQPVTPRTDSHERIQRTLWIIRTWYGLYW